MPLSLALNEMHKVRERSKAQWSKTYRMRTQKWPVLLWSDQSFLGPHTVYLAFRTVWKLMAEIGYMWIHSYQHVVHISVYPCLRNFCNMKILIICQRSWKISTFIKWKSVEARLCLLSFDKNVVRFARKDFWHFKKNI